ncbi:MAG TPA: DoxX family protein [Vicinamibacterales bacterium]|nr:DoxX family protein [Vicinamibacterales bacterium]
MKNALLWVLSIVTAGMFVLAGTLKLAGVEMAVQLFATIGIGQWFRYFTGLLEITGAIGLFIAALAPFAALLLTAIMIGAITTHLFIVGGSPIAPIVLLASSLTIAWLRWSLLRREPFRSRRAIVA